MALDNKIADRIDKLMRLAAPTSGAPLPERESAAIEAAKLFAEYNITARAEQPKAVEKPNTVHYNVWMLSIALQHCSCSHCHKLISRSDRIWIKVQQDSSVESRHNCKPCSPT